MLSFIAIALFYTYTQPSRKKPKADRDFVCPHCEENLAWKTFSNHKRLFFDSEKKRWIKSSQLSREVTRDVSGASTDVNSNGLVDCSGESPPSSPIGPVSFCTEDTDVDHDAYVDVDFTFMEPQDIGE